MSLFIEEEGNIKLDFDTEEIAALVIDAALELADCPYEAEINLLLTENAQIHEMNLEQRGIDRPTDVLSFPMIEYEEPGDFSVIDEESAEAFNPESGELMLGDIVISKEKVLSQAEEYGHLPKREYALHTVCFTYLDTITWLMKSVLLWKQNRKKSWKKSVFSADWIHILNRF